MWNLRELRKLCRNSKEQKSQTPLNYIEMCLRKTSYTL